MGRVVPGLARKDGSAGDYGDSPTECNGAKSITNRCETMTEVAKEWGAYSVHMKNGQNPPHFRFGDDEKGTYLGDLAERRNPLVLSWQPRSVAVVFSTTVNCLITGVSSVAPCAGSLERGSVHWKRMIASTCAARIRKSVVSGKTVA